MKLIERTFGYGHSFPGACQEEQYSVSSAWASNTKIKKSETRKKPVRGQPLPSDSLLGREIIVCTFHLTIKHSDMENGDKERTLLKILGYGHFPSQATVRYGKHMLFLRGSITNQHQIKHQHSRTSTQDKAAGQRQQQDILSNQSRLNTN